MARYTLKDWARFVRENKSFSDEERQELASILDVSKVKLKPDRDRLGILTDDEMARKRREVFSKTKIANRYVEKLIAQGLPIMAAYREAAAKFDLSPDTIKSNFNEQKRKKHR